MPFSHSVSKGFNFSGARGRVGAQVLGAQASRLPSVAHLEILN
jgi:hypothetical protein